MWKVFRHKVGAYLPALRSLNYRLFFIGQSVSLIGSWISSVAFQWLVYPTLTDNRSLLGIVSALSLFPTFFFALFAGVIIDRVDKKKALIASQIAYCLIALLLYFLVFLDKIQVWQVLILAIVSGIVFAIYFPLSQSLVITLVDKKHIASVLSLNFGSFNFARAIGPAIGGAIIATYGIAPAFLIDALSYISIIFVLSLIRIPKDVNLPQPQSRKFKDELLEGISYIRSNKEILTLLILTGLLTLFSWPAATLMPVFAHDIFKKGEIGFGLLQSFFGAGAVTSAIFFSKIFSRVKDKMLFLKKYMYLLCLGYATFSLNKSFPLALIIYGMNGWLIGVTVAFLNTQIQLNTPEHIRGRITSFYSFVLVGSMPFGALLASAGVYLIGARYTVLIAALSLMIFSSVVFKLRKSLS